MTKPRGPSYAVVLAAAFVLWFPVALFGTQGYSALLALAAIPAAFYAVWLRPNRITIALTGLAVWAAVSSLWSAEAVGIVAGDLGRGNFTIDAAGIRMLLTTLAGALVISASLRIVPGRGRLALAIVLFMLAAHGLCTLAMGLLPDVALGAYAPFSDPVREAPQNILRSANAFLLGLPVLLGAIWMLRKPALRWCLGLLVLAGSLVAFILVASDVAILGVVAIAASLLVVTLFQNTGFKVLLVAAASFITLSPAILGLGGAAVSEADIPLPSSVQSRVWAWQLTTGKIAERPIAGHGIEASKEWRETFADRPDLLKQMKQQTGIDDGRWEHYRILPGHPHNMGLQLWAETGLIGVALAVLSLLLIAWKLPSPAEMRPGIAVATASLIGASFALFSLSYSLWNEAFWATVVLAAAGVILLSRRTVGEA